MVGAAFLNYPVAFRNSLINFCWCCKLWVVFSLCSLCSTTNLTETLQDFQQIPHILTVPNEVVFQWDPVDPGKSCDSETFLFSSTALPHTGRFLCHPCQCLVALQHKGALSIFYRKFWDNLELYAWRPSQNIEPKNVSSWIPITFLAEQALSPIDTLSLSANWTSNMKDA